MSKIKSAAELISWIIVGVIGVCAILIIVGACISWYSSGVYLMGNTNLIPSNFNEHTLNSLMGSIRSYGEEMRAAIRLNVALVAVLAVCAAGSAVVAAAAIKWERKVFKGVALVLALLCIALGVALIFTSRELSDLFLQELGASSSGSVLQWVVTVSAGPWMTSICGMIAGIAGGFAVIKEQK